MTIVVIGHVGVDICLIVTKRLRLRATVMRREMVPVIRRLPRLVTGFVERRVDRRSLDKHGLNDICRTIDIRLADDLAIGC